MRLVYTAVFLSFSLFIQAQNSLDDLIKNFENDEQLKNASWSILAENLSNQEEIISKDIERSLIPASTLKLITTGLALKELGPEYKFRTMIGHTGTIKDSTLYGDLVFKGGGDPSFRMRDWPELDIVHIFELKEIISFGIKRIEGNLVVDLSHYKESNLTPETWVYQDLGNYYGASPSSFCFNENFDYICFNQNYIEGKPVELDSSATKLLEFVEIINEVRTGPANSGDRAYVYAAPNTSKYEIRGTIPPGDRRFCIKASMHNPAEFFLRHFQRLLEEQEVTEKIEFEGDIEISEEFIPLKDTIIRMTYTNELRKLVKTTNVKSNNLYAEQILNEMLLHMNRGKENQLTAQNAIQDKLKELDVYTDGLFIFDGSGLSRYNGITTKTQVQFLKSMEKSEVFEDFYQSLAIGGETGTVKNMFKAIGDWGDFRIKSGTLNRVRAYTGYIKNNRDELIAFSIIVNNYSGSSSKMKKKLEDIMIAISLE